MKYIDKVPKRSFSLFYLSHLWSFIINGPVENFIGFFALSAVHLDADGCATRTAQKGKYLRRFHGTTRRTLCLPPTSYNSHNR